MKTLNKIFLIAAVILLSGSWQFAFSSDNIKNEIISDQPDTIVYTVYGMDCPGCAGGLEKQVNKIPEVKFSDANWMKQELKIVLEEGAQLDIEELEKRVKKANFTLAKDEKNKDK